MCGGAFGQFQNFRHKAQMGFGLIPENSLTGKRVQFERDAEDYVSSSESHQTAKTMEKRKAKQEAQSVENTKAAQADAKASTEVADKAEADFYAQMDERNKKNAVAETSNHTSATNTKLSETKTNNKGTLLGG